MYTVRVWNQCRLKWQKQTTCIFAKIMCNLTCVSNESIPLQWQCHKEQVVSRYDAVHNISPIVKYILTCMWLGLASEQRIRIPIFIYYKSVVLQECIPLGCVPPAAVAVPVGGVVSARAGVVCPGGVCPGELPGGCLPATTLHCGQNDRHM